MLVAVVITIITIIVDKYGDSNIHLFNFKDVLDISIWNRKKMYGSNVEVELNNSEVEISK